MSNHIDAIACGTVVNTTPCRVPFTFPKHAGRNEVLSTEVDGLIISVLSIEQPEMDFSPPFDVDKDGSVIGEYPYLQVLCIAQAIERIKNDLWRKNSTHIPML